MQKREPIDDLNELLNRTSAYFDAPVEVDPSYNQPKQVNDYAGDEAISRNYTPINQVGDVPKTPEAKFANQGYNIMANEAGDQSNELETEANRVRLAQIKKMQEQDELSNEKVSMAREYIGQERRKPGDYSQLQARIEKMIDDAEKPQQEDMMSQLIASFGPGLMGMALGGSAGLSAAKPAYEDAQKFQEQRRKNNIEIAKSRREAAAKALEGFSKLQGEEAKGLAEYDKAGLERAKFMGEVMEKAGATKQELAKFYSDWASGKEKDSTEMFKKRLEIGKEGIKTTVEQDQKQNDRNLKEKIAKKKSAEKLSPFEKKKQEKFGEAAAEYSTKDKPQLEGNISNLKSVISELSKFKDDDWEAPTGKGKGLLKDELRNFTNPKAVELKKKVMEISAQLLKPTLGSQFTEKDREVISGLNWDDSAPVSTNLARVKRMEELSRKRYNFSNALYKHLEQNNGSDANFDYKKWGMEKIDQAPKESAAPQSFAKDVLDYAKKHNISNEAAQKIKDSRGGK